MYQVCICPKDEIYHINKKTVSEAKTVALDFYPAALFMEVIDHVQIAIYERTQTGLDHIGNIWKIA